MNGLIGQTARNQIDCLANLGAALENSENQLWQTKNGYALASHEGLVRISKRLKASSEKELDDLRQLLQISVQWNTQVTLNDAQRTITQVYCSALPMAYTRHSPDLWENFARLILDASYQAMICSAILNSISTGNRMVFLTFLGGGAFGNPNY